MPRPAPLAPSGQAAPGDIAAHQQDQSDDELARYWTQDRIAHAVNAQVLTRPGGTGDGQPPEAGSGSLVSGLLYSSGLAGAVAPAAVTRATATGNQVSRYTGGGLAARVDGALFATIAGHDYACSGSVVSSPAGDLVLTAAHCLHSGGAGGVFASNVIFIPGYAGGRAPYGIWSARQLTVTSGWGYRRDFDEDAGFATFRPVGGRSLAQAVGGSFPIVFGQGLQPQTVLSYPKLSPYDGRTLMSCSGQPVRDPRGGRSLGIACAMTSGASGGPWLANFQGGAGTIDSVVSYAYSTEPGTIYGTWFGPAIQQLYQHAIAL